jgi:integrase
MTRKNGIYRRGRVYWLQVETRGERYRTSLHTANWNEAQTAARRAITEIQAGKRQSRAVPFAKMPFTTACDAYLGERALRVSARTIRTEKEHWNHLRDFFGQKLLHRISEDDVREYLLKRRAAKAANRTINIEIGILRRIVVRARRLHAFSDSDVFKPLPEKKDIGRALSHDERLRLLAKAKERPEWMNAYLAATIALNTTMRSGEIRRLQWRDIDFLDRSLVVREAKTDAGVRVIPLNGDAFAAIMELRERAREIGATEPDHYLFPSQEGFSAPDPTRPVKDWRSAWRSLRAKAGLSWLRFHDLRHTAITNLAEGQASDTTILDIAGHVSMRMLRHYSHVRKETKRRALDALSTLDSRPNTMSGTKSGTIGSDEIGGEMSGIETKGLVGGADGARTRDLRRDRPAF